MSTMTDGVRGRVDLSLSTVGLALGDLVAIALFVVAGEIKHGIDPIANTAIVADTLSQFLIGWVVFSLLAGAYGTAARQSPRQAAIATGGAWFGTVVVAQLLRSTAFFHGNAALTFALVSLGVGGVLLLAWRQVVAVITSRRLGSVTVTDSSIYK